MAWTQQDLDYLTEHYGTKTSHEIGEILEKSPSSIRSKARELKLSQPRVSAFEPWHSEGLSYIPLNSKRHPGHVAVVNEFNFPIVSRYRWSPLVTRSGSVYAKTRIKGKIVLMHHLLMRPLPRYRIEHRDHDSLNNQVRNLARALLVSAPREEGSYRGVSRVKSGWMARCGEDYLGVYETPEDAARAYNEKARKKWGDHARTNLMPEDPKTPEEALMRLKIPY